VRVCGCFFSGTCSTWVLGTLADLLAFVALWPFVVLWPYWKLLGSLHCCVVFLNLVTFLWIIWEPPIKLWNSSQTCTCSVTTLNGPIVDQGFHFWWEGSRTTQCAIVAFGVPCAATALQWRVASARVWTSGHIVMSWLLLNPSSFTYERFFVIALVVEVLYLAITLLLAFHSTGCWRT
jgi:hypothetical protein